MNVMRGIYKGKWYAEVFESERYIGTRTISIHEFHTEESMEEFIYQYNSVSLSADGAVPAVYRMAQTAYDREIREYLNGVKFDV